MCDIEVMGAPPDISYGSYRREFTALWVEAGSPSAEAIAQGLKERLLREEVNRWVGWLKARQPVSEAVRKAIEKIKNQGLGVPAATLRGWIKAPWRVPSSDAQLMQVVAFLSIRAVQRGERAKYVVSPAEFDRWAALRQGAWEHGNGRELGMKLGKPMRAGVMSEDNNSHPASSSRLASRYRTLTMLMSLRY